MRSKKEYLFSIVALLVIGIDQVTKYFAFADKLRSFLNAMRPLFQQLRSQNYNFAFSLPLPHLLAYVIYAIIIIAFVSWYVSEEKTTPERIGFYLVIGGAISNIIDRIALGYVRDFILGFWGNIFNLADVAIVAGIILILIVNVQKPAIQKS